MRDFRLGTHVRIGPDSLSALETYADRRVLLVTDEFLATTPVFSDVLSRLGGNVSIFCDVVPNPTISAISRGTAAYLDARPEVVVAYGGGSVMDAAKAMHKAALDSGFGAVDGLVAIPTTSGSGSEVTSFAVLTDERTHTKIPLVSSDMVARLAILDPEAVVGVPPRITADSGMDVLTHAVEAYVSVNACDFSDALAEKAVELVVTHLVRCYTHGSDRDARAHMHNASCLAAMAFDNVNLGITHSLAHAVGGHFCVAHGRLNAMLLPHVIAFNAERSTVAAERYARLGRLITSCSVGRAAVTSLITAVQKLSRDLGIPDSIADEGISTEEYRAAVPEMAATALEDGCTPSNPAKPSREDLILLLRKIG